MVRPLINTPYYNSEQAVMVLIESAGSYEPGGPPNVALYGPACGPWYQKH